MTNEEKAIEYAQLHPYDGDRVQLYVECHNGKIAAFKAGAEWKEKQISEKIKKWVMDNTYLDSRDQLFTKHYRTAYEMIDEIKKAIMEE